MFNLNRYYRDTRFVMSISRRNYLREFKSRLNNWIMLIAKKSMSDISKILYP
jgi:hypothetical protein